ncbi:MAG: S9 family peptidase [Candidatus Zixiibacteriota bacterium]|nr:MAG: S9 family peptidase [candidate division Zixibacteria bacterium]
MIGKRICIPAAVAALVILTLAIPVCASAPDAGSDYTYPSAPEGEVTYRYHGIEIADPYRWLEDPNAEETMTWVAAENRLTAKFVNTPEREAFKGRLTELWNYAEYWAPIKAGGRYFYMKNDGRQEQGVWYMQETPDDTAIVVLDPNVMSDDGTISVSHVRCSRNGRLMAYALSKSGSDWQTIKIREIDSGRDFEESIEWCKFTDIAWKHDNSGFFYCRFPDTINVAQEDRSKDHRVFWHTLNTPQSQDRLVYERPDDRELGFEPIVTDDGKYLLLDIWRGTNRCNRVYYREIDGDGEFVRLLDAEDARYVFIDNIGTHFYFKTDLNAPRGRIIVIDIDNPRRSNWKVIVPEQDDVLTSAEMINNQLVLAYLHDVSHQLKIFNFDGTFDREIELPTLGAVYGLDGERPDTEIFFGFYSYLNPRIIFKYDFATHELTTYHRPDIDFDPSEFETRRVFYFSKDSTRIPMFIMHRKNLILDGNNPTILCGYGGFAYAMTPGFSRSKAVWMENGGVYAVACIRGGDEYGESWHEAGMLENRQNVFDDFISAAEWLIANKYTRSSRLAIEGASNGGLLVAVCMTQRPELFGAVICRVPLTDMLRYHKFTIGYYWTGEYGNPEKDPQAFEYISAYSPLHNIREGATFPATLVTTADSDNRVFPAHAKKFVAALQAADSGENPILLRAETRAGHGSGKPTTKILDEYADIFGFLFRVFGMSFSGAE